MNRPRKIKMNQSNSAIMDRLMALHPKLIDLNLERIERLLAALGNPERKLAPVVHIAGTNGKGSTAAFLVAIFKAAGLSAHVYTSPHLVRFNERIVVASREISDEMLAGVLQRCEAANAGAPITFFEITTAAAFLAFSETPADVVILETGLGGRLDATNVIDQPALTLITPISLDHQHFLGDDIGDIAGEKAAIMKAGVPCLSAAQSSKKVERVLRKNAEAVGAPLAFEGADWFMRPQPKDGTLAFMVEGVAMELPHPVLSGRHQLQNAGLAVAAARALRATFELPDAAIRLGLKTVHWPGRLQRLDKGPLVAGLPTGMDEGWELWLDGGHNPAAAGALARHLRGWRDKPVWLVFGALNTRDPLTFLKPFEGKVAGLRAVAVPGEENTLEPEAGCEAAHMLHINAEVATDVGAGVRAIIENGGDTGRILICGSLYLAGSVLAENG